MLQNEFTTVVLRATDREDLLRKVLHCVHGLGFKVSALMAVVDRCAGKSEFASVFNDGRTQHGKDAA